MRSHIIQIIAFTIARRDVVAGAEAFGGSVRRRRGAAAARRGCAGVVGIGAERSRLRGQGPDRCAADAVGCRGADAGGRLRVSSKTRIVMLVRLLRR